MTRMPTLGIVGGIGPESTIEYYRQLMVAFRERDLASGPPGLVIDSIDVGRVLTLAADPARKQELAEYLLASLSRLASAGADVGLLAANTPHIVFDELVSRSPIGLISIVQATCDFAKQRGLKRLGLFGTRSTMQAGFYQKAFAAAGLEIVTPAASEQNYIHEKYVGELVPGIFHDETRLHMLAIARRMREEDRIEGLILGGTELPLLLSNNATLGIPLLDTTRIHVNAALKELIR